MTTSDDPVGDDGALRPTETYEPRGVAVLSATAALAALWLAVRGVPLTPTRLAAETVTGLAVAFPIAYTLRRFYEPMTGLSPTLRVCPAAGLYLLTFASLAITGTVDVAARTLRPSMPIDPDVVEVPLRVESDLAITTIANSITLTPGTLTMDYDADRNSLYVHSIDGSDAETVIDPIRTWEEYALVIFDERLKPGDPVPSVGDVGDDRPDAAADRHGEQTDGGDR